MKWKCRDWESMGVKGVVELFITHRNEMVIKYLFVHLFSV